MRLDHSSRRRHAATLALGVAAALALAGCTGGGDDPPATGTTSVPTPITTATTTTATTPPATAASTGMPDAAKQNSRAGAEAFVKYFVEEQDRSWMVPDDRVLPPLFDPACAVCATVQKAAEQLVHEKQTVSGDPTSVDEVRTVGLTATGETVVRMTGIQNAITVRDSAGRTVASVPRKDVTWSFHVRWQNGWKVSDLLQAPA